MRPEASAWMTLLVFFGLFCALVAAGVVWGWSSYTNAMQPQEGTLLRVHVGAGVTRQARGQLSPESIERLPADRDPCAGQADVCLPLVEGASVSTKREAGYGPVASVVLPDQSQVDLWAHPTGADFELLQYRVSRWNDRRQEVILRHAAGYARYDIANNQPFREVFYTVVTDSGVRVRLAAGGSYSINVPQPEPGRVAPRSLTGAPVVVEVAARRGSAIIEHDGREVLLEQGELVNVSPAGLETPLPARWELLHDGTFAHYEAYGRYLPDANSLSWEQFWNPLAPDMTASEQSGRFQVVRACRPETPDFCTPENQIDIGQIRRDGDPERPFANGIQQRLDADVSEYTSLRFRAWVRVLDQKVPEAGIAGSECPVMITIAYKPTSPTDREQFRRFCAYIDDDAIPPSVQASGEIWYRPVPAFQWYRLEVELRNDELLRQARYLQMIYIEARGHRYLSEITGISLEGRQ
jgi:hypothetical protein